MSQQKANNYLKTFREKVASPAAAAGAGVGSAVAIDQMLYNDSDHAAEKVNYVRDSYRENREAGSAINYIYGEEGVGPPINQMQVAKVLAGGEDSENGRAYLEATRPEILVRIQEVASKRPDLIPILAQNERIVSAANLQGIQSQEGAGAGLDNTYTSDGVTEAYGMVAGGLGGAGTYVLADQANRRFK